MSQMSAKFTKGIFCTALVFLLALPTGCTSKGQIQETPNNIAKPLSRSFEMKEWNEAQYRRPASQQIVYDQNLAKEFPGVFFYQGNKAKKQVALTFDDGPDDYYTPKILSILRAKKAPATFFVVGEHARMFPNVLREIVQNGNTVGNHTFDHPRIPTLSQEGVTEELQKTEREIQSITGVRTDLLRPPYGFLHNRDVPLIHSLGYRIVDWSLDTGDFRNHSSAQIMTNVKSTLKPGTIIAANCMADQPHQLDGLIQALPQMIDYIRSKGYQLVTVQTLLAP